MAEATLKSTYKPDLDELISQCEINYCFIVKLFPTLLKKNFEKLSNISDEVDLNDLQRFQSIVTLRIIDVARYTTTLEMKFRGPSNIVRQNLKLIVRLYHDAKLLEVMEGVSATKLSAIRAVQDKKQYPVKFVDEKRQLNAFLGESLQYCLNLHRDEEKHSESNGCR